MQEIRNPMQQLVCMADAASGVVEIKEKSGFIKLYLAIGGRFERDYKGYHNIITRVSNAKFKVICYLIAA